MGRLSYNTIQTTFKSKGCTLLTTEDEFIKEHMNAKSNFTIVSQCGHETQVKYDMFKAKSTGTICKNCRIESLKLRLSPCSEQIEYSGYTAIRDMIVQDNALDVVKMVEGTKADFAVKPNVTTYDKWLPIQLKVTNSPSVVNSNNYSFRKVGNGYDGMLVICFCVSDRRMWLLPYEIVKSLKTLSIGAKTSKYHSYECTLAELSRKLLHYYEGDERFKKESEANLNLPVSDQQKREQEFRKVRENTFPFLKFQYPEQEKLCYDFTVNGLKIQEKVATCIRKRGKLVENSLVVNLMSSSKTYKLGDNDLYWIHTPNKELFYLIPEQELYEHGFLDISSTDRMLRLYPGKEKEDIKHKWVVNYCFRYDKIPKDVFDMLKCDKQLL